jgi:hypothetical protein
MKMEEPCLKPVACNRLIALVDMSLTNPTVLNHKLCFKEDI